VFITAWPPPLLPAPSSPRSPLTPPFLPQAALGEKAKAGPHTVFVEKDGQRFAIGTLDAARCPQFSCDITFALDEVVLSHSGPSEVHLTGYAVQAMMMGESSDDEERRYARGFGERAGCVAGQGGRQGHGWGWREALPAEKLLQQLLLSSLAFSRRMSAVSTAAAVAHTSHPPTLSHPTSSV
jgi:hypothetical protein